MASTSKQQKSNKNRKYGRNKDKCARYRSRVGKPLGKGVSGNKLGKKRVRKQPWQLYSAKDKSRFSAALSLSQNFETSYFQTTLS